LFSADGDVVDVDVEGRITVSPCHVDGRPESGYGLRLSGEEKRLDPRPPESTTDSLDQGVGNVRIGLISDIHGNVVALDAVLADCRASGVEHFWFLGDFAAIGPEPAAALERVTQLGNVQFTRGNTDRYVVSGEGPRRAWRRFGPIRR
jgi:hypothetical protein